MKNYIVLCIDENSDKIAWPIKGFRDYDEAEGFADQMNEYTQTDKFYADEKPVEIDV